MAMPLAVEGLSWVTRNFHGLPGRWRLVNWLDRHEREFAAMNSKTVRFSGRFRMCVNPVDENGRRIYINGYQPKERLTRHFVRLLRPGDCMLDVGANVGYYTMVAAKLVGPTGHVHAFEASPRIYPLLKKNAELNPDANIQVHCQAVTEKCGDVEFSTATAEQTGYSSIRDLGDKTTHVATVPTVSLDSLLDEFPKTRLVKIDVEGAELMVLSGMRRLIERDRPYFIFESDDGFLRELGADASRPFQFLADAGYEMSRIVAKGDLHPLEQAPLERCNILAVPPRD